MIFWHAIQFVVPIMGLYFLFQACATAAVLSAKQNYICGFELCVFVLVVYDDDGDVLVIGGGQLWRRLIEYFRTNAPLSPPPLPVAIASRLHPEIDSFQSSLSLTLQMV